MIYTNSNDIKNELKKILIDEKLTFTELSIRMNETRQQVNNYFSKKNFSFNDLKRMTDALGYKIEINIIKSDK